MFRFTDANVYYALYILSDGRTMGRKRLAAEVGVGEGSMRRILEKFTEWGFVLIRQTGISITSSGKAFLEQIPLRLSDVQLEALSITGPVQQSVIVYGVAKKIVNGMEQRDAGIKAGATGCTTLVIRDGKLMIPPDWSLDEHSPELAYKIRKARPSRLMTRSSSAAAIRRSRPSSRPSMLLSISSDADEASSQLVGFRASRGCAGGGSPRGPACRDGDRGAGALHAGLPCRQGIHRSSRHNIGPSALCD
ncbi:DUF4443 domain-containing protein [Candidatus Methanomethylophilus sp. 1R26]|uniref:DUF4443 domain-containing protein n=1 Tax=Candidatus Methanomethylophilus sp. 1R26 TaxID=1769296 RepID=UPI001F3151DD|nr:DUF4443 domain-containing protein [Candidatus Methanomethylophilus sp. 1R26]